MSHKALARGVRELAARRGDSVSCDHTAVSRWLNGTRPRERTAELVAAVLGARLGRTVTLADIGLPTDDPAEPDLGIGYPDDVRQATAALSQLWKADHDEVRAIMSAPAVASAWVEAGLSWVVRSNAETVNGRRAGVRVGPADVQRVQVTVDAFAKLDDTFGGGHARRLLIEFLRTDAAALLAGDYGEATGKALYAAVAEAALLAAWMSYDAGVHGLAQRYFIQGLRLAQAADDVLLAASILDAMSHQATFLGRFREAANLARAARHGTASRATPALTMHFYAMEARAHAVAGDSAATDRALGNAVRALERGRPANEPDWSAYMNDHEMASEFGHCYRDLGRHKDAIPHAMQAFPSGSTRTDFFVMMVLAVAYLGVGEVEEACAAARRALDLGEGLKSARCAENVRAFRTQLAGFGHMPAVQDLARTAVDHPLWTPAGTAA